MRSTLFALSMASRNSAVSFLPIVVGVMVALNVTWATIDVLHSPVNSTARRTNIFLDSSTIIRRKIKTYLCGNKINGRNGYKKTVNYTC